MRAFSTMLAVGAFCILLVAQQAAGGGSFSTGDVEPLLLQDPAIHRFITDTLDLESMGWALRIGRNPALSGTRVAPYSIRAKPKGTKDWQFMLVIEATTTYYDQAGNEVAGPGGTSIKEKFTGIRLRPLTSDEHR